MKRMITLSAIALLAASSAAFADSKPTDAEATKIKETLSAWGCEGGALEKETEGTGVFEIDDAKCKDGRQYDFKLNADYTVRSMTSD